MACAVIQHGIKKTLGLAGTRTGGDQGRSGLPMGSQPLPSLLLVAVQRKIYIECREKIPVHIAPLERQTDRKIGAFVKPAGRLDQCFKGPGEPGRGGLESGNDIGLQPLDDLFG
jgi:hypothetical protein